MLFYCIHHFKAVSFWFLGKGFWKPLYYSHTACGLFLWTWACKLKTLQLLCFLPCMLWWTCILLLMVSDEFELCHKLQLCQFKNAVVSEIRCSSGHPEEPGLDSSIVNLCVPAQPIQRSIKCPFKGKVGKVMCFAAIPHMTSKRKNGSTSQTSLLGNHNTDPKNSFNR